MRRIGKSKTSQLQHKADSLLQTYITAKYPKCEVCGNPSQCGHHLVEKSRSNRLRYELSNLVPVCVRCHSKIHNTIFGHSANRLLDSYNVLDEIFKRRGGKKWKDKLEQTGRELVKTNVGWYEDHIEKLESLIAEL